MVQDGGGARVRAHLRELDMRVDQRLVLARVRAHLREQAAACRRLGSPFTALLLELAAERLDPGQRVGRTVLAWPGNPRADALALRLAGGLHALVLSGADRGLAAVYPGGERPASGPGGGAPDALWTVVAGALEAHAAFLLRFLEGPPQTNEPARAAALLGGFLTIGGATRRPLRLLEIGASAGLNLHWDALAYVLGAARWGPADAPLRLAPAWRGPPPPLLPVTVAARRGCDRAPLDPGSPDDRLRLRAYVWADQRERLARLEVALDHAARRTVRVERADAGPWVE